MGFVVGLLDAEDPQPIGDTSGRAISAARTDPRKALNGTLECMLLPIVQLHPSDEVKNPYSKEDLFQTLDTLCNARSWRLLH